MSLGLPLVGDASRDKDVQWMVPALFSWLSDERVRRTAARENCATHAGIGLLGGILHMSLSTGQPVDPKMLRRSALDLIGNRKVRRIVARIVMERQVALREEFPTQAPPAKSARDILAELQDLRKELEMEFETGIVRPF